MDNKFVLSQSFNEIVFEKRNKKYGAYDIRRKYARYTLLAGAAAILFFTCGSFTWAYVAQVEDTPDWRVIDMDITPPLPGVKPVDPPKPADPPKPIEPKISAAQIGPKTPQLTAIINIVDTDSVPPSNLEAGRDPKGDSSGTGSGPVVKLPEGNCINCKQDSVPPIVIRDWTPFPPECPGLDEHIKKNINYPQMCREQGIEGTVYVEFIVDTKGNYRDVKVMKGPHPALNREALRVMMSMPTWTPAKDENGTLVDFIMRKPIRFSLNK